MQGCSCFLGLLFGGFRNLLRHPGSKVTLDNAVRDLGIGQGIQIRIAYKVLGVSRVGGAFAKCVGTDKVFFYCVFYR